VAITAALGFERDDGRWFRRGIWTKIHLAVLDRVPPVETRSRFRKGKCPSSARPKMREFRREVWAGLDLSACLVELKMPELGPVQNA